MDNHCLGSLHLRFAPSEAAPQFCYVLFSKKWSYYGQAKQV